MTLAIRWSHEAGENARLWPHEPGDWHVRMAPRRSRRLRCPGRSPLSRARTRRYGAQRERNPKGRPRHPRSALRHRNKGPLRSGSKVAARQPNRSGHSLPLRLPERRAFSPAKDRRYRLRICALTTRRRRAGWLRAQRSRRGIAERSGSCRGPDATGAPANFMRNSAFLAPPTCDSDTGWHVVGSRRSPLRDESPRAQPRYGALRAPRARRCRASIRCEALGASDGLPARVEATTRTPLPHPRAGAEGAEHG